MSGGVDSTACALLLREHCQVHGFFMKLTQPDIIEQEERVTAIAKTLNIPLSIIDLSLPFKERVLNYFSESYFGGLTPNPCVVCNREIKFGLFLETILHSGMTMMATGHYAKIRRDGDLCRLFCGDDQTKDQSYFLARLRQEQLSKILFPLGDTTKEATYQLVKKHGFHDFEGCESQDVCFLAKTSVGSFLAQRRPLTDVSGPIVSTSGKILGTHNGVFNYTIGQRKGLGIASDQPLYVIALNTATNTVIVGANDELFRKEIAVANFHWLAGSPPDITKEYTVRIRYSHRGSSAQLSLMENSRGRITFQKPQRAITPGQFAVVYDDRELLGSGIIQ